jgi:hypothetical protein
MTDRAKKITELDAITSPASTDLLIIETDPSGTPSTKKITLQNLLNAGYITSNAYQVANSTSSGVIKVGSQLSINATGHLSANINVANTTGAGIIKVGDQLSINATGFLNTNLNTANVSSAGVIKVGNNVSVNATGFLNIDLSTYVTNDGLNYALNDYVTTGILATNLANYVTISSLSANLAGISRISNGSSNVSVTGANGTVTIRSNANTWTYETNGTLTLPNGGKLYAGFPVLAPYDPTLVTLSANQVYLASSNGATYLGLEPGFASIAIAGATGSAAYWEFANSKITTVPGTIKAPQLTKASNDSGAVGEICWDANYIYVCTSANVWKRAALTDY